MYHGDKKKKIIFVGYLVKNKVFSAGKLSHHNKRYSKPKNISPFGQWFEEFPQ